MIRKRSRNPPREKTNENTNAQKQKQECGKHDTDFLPNKSQMAPTQSQNGATRGPETSPKWASGSDFGSTFGAVSNLNDNQKPRAITTRS